jgi:hypothetical protein
MLDEPYDPRNAIPLDPEQFRRVLNLVTRAGRGDIPAIGPEGWEASHFDEETGIVEEVRLTDHPLVRMALTVSAFYQGDSAGYYSAAQRLFGFMNIVRHPELEPWTDDDGETTRVHDAVIEAAAVAELDEEGLFLVEPFLELVRQIAGEKYT